MRVFWLGLALTVALLFAVYAGFLWLITWLAPDSLRIPGVGQVTWVGDLLGWGSLLIMLIMSIFLMVPVASAITSLFLDNVADAVEAEHYPELGPAPRVPWVEAIRDSLGFFAVVVVFNLMALVIWVFVPLLSPFIFYIVNGYLLGREYFYLTALRRRGRDGARDMAARWRGTIWIAGTLMALPLSVPLLNLFIPILGAATFTHIYHGLDARERR